MHNSNTPSFLLIRIVAIRSSCLCLAGELNVNNIELYETNIFIRKISGIKSIENFVSVYTEKDSMIKTAQKAYKEKNRFRIEFTGRFDRVIYFWKARFTVQSKLPTFPVLSPKKGNTLFVNMSAINTRLKVI